MKGIQAAACATHSHSYSTAQRTNFSLSAWIHLPVILEGRQVSWLQALTVCRLFCVSHCYKLMFLERDGSCAAYLLLPTTHAKTPFLSYCRLSVQTAAMG